MEFLKRLGFYMIGLAIGIVFLAFFLKKKSEETGTEFCYFPNCRTLKDIRSKPLSYSDEIEAKLKETGFDVECAISTFYFPSNIFWAGCKLLRHEKLKSKWVDAVIACNRYFIDRPHWRLKGAHFIIRARRR